MEKNLDIYTGSTYLKPGKTYYLSMLARIDGMIPFFAGKFNLSGSGLQFTNNSKSLLTNPTDFRAYSGNIGYGLCKTQYSYEFPTTIPGVTYIHALGGGKQVWFSATIIPE